MQSYRLKNSHTSPAVSRFQSGSNHCHWVMVEYQMTVIITFEFNKTPVELWFHTQPDTDMGVKRFSWKIWCRRAPYCLFLVLTITSPIQVYVSPCFLWKHEDSIDLWKNTKSSRYHRWQHARDHRGQKTESIKCSFLNAMHVCKEKQQQMMIGMSSWNQTTPVSENHYYSIAPQLIANQGTLLTHYLAQYGLLEIAISRYCAGIRFTVHKNRSLRHKCVILCFFFWLRELPRNLKFVKDYPVANSQTFAAVNSQVSHEVIYSQDTCSTQSSLLIIRGDLFICVWKLCCLVLNGWLRYICKIILNSTQGFIGIVWKLKSTWFLACNQKCDMWLA